MMENYTRFERARMIGARALQIARGAPLLFKTDLKDPIKIAELEFEQGILPMGIRRKMPLRMETA
ncbi:MAG: DNA-directed RNA polymerase subunit K [Nanoarchaeota archaeon]|nr:DNA-directed RNA polymerase subunit K [Nanoarchaeota archaeon]MBU4124094.1 DNA-directed RNA polymerase subunit K [Nanoarchaeota archaeon]